MVSEKQAFATVPNPAVALLETSQIIYHIARCFSYAIRNNIVSDILILSSAF